MIKKFCKVSLLSVCIGISSVCIVNVKATRRELCNTARKTIAAKYSSDFDVIKYKDKFMFNELLEMAMKKDINDIIEDLLKLDYGKLKKREIISKRRKLLSVFDDDDREKEKQLWETFWDAYIGGLVKSCKDSFLINS